MKDILFVITPYAHQLLNSIISKPTKVMTALHTRPPEITLQINRLSAIRMFKEKNNVTPIFVNSMGNFVKIFASSNVFYARKFFSIVDQRRLFATKSCRPNFFPIFRKISYKIINFGRTQNYQA